MENNKALIAAITAILISIGAPISVNLFNVELKFYYRCDMTGDISEFKGGISGTAYSGYPFEDSRKGAKYCRNDGVKGTWQQISEYAESVGVDAYDLMDAAENQIVPNSNNAGVWGRSCKAKSGEECKFE